MRRPRFHRGPEEEVASTIKGLKTGLVREMMKVSAVFGTRWMTDMTDLINNIVKESCLLFD